MIYCKLRLSPLVFSYKSKSGSSSNPAARASGRVGVLKESSSGTARTGLCWDASLSRCTYGSEWSVSRTEAQVLDPVAKGLRA